MFAFVMRKEGVDFKEALNILAERAGIPVVQRKADESKSEADRLKEVNEAELARTNASVTGTPLKHFNCVEKDGVCGGMNQDYVNSDKGANASSSFASNSNINDVINLNLNIKGDTTFQFYRGATNTNMIGGITSVTPR